MWHDRWLLDEIPRTPIIMAPIVDNILRVLDLLCNISGRWNESFLHQLFIPADVNRLLQIKTRSNLNDSLEKKLWTLLWKVKTTPNYIIICGTV